MEVTEQLNAGHEKRKGQVIVAPADTEGIRLDVFLLRHAPELTRGAVQRSIKEGHARIAGKRVIKPSTIVHAGQQIVWEVRPQPLRSPREVQSSTLPALNILHEDPWLLVLDKPAGVPVHVGVRREPTIADALLTRYPDLNGVGERPERPGIVHRLDKDTSGVLLVARTQEMYEHLKKQFQQRQVRKEYLALVHGIVPEDDGAVKLPIIRSKRNPLRRTIARSGDGKEAETYFRVLERFREHTLLAVYPRTGRMHQIRVHLTHLGFPIAGDPLYGRKSRYRTPPGLRRQFLHAKALTVAFPSGKTKTFESPLPHELARVLEALRQRGRVADDTEVTYRWRAPRAPRGG